MVPAVPLLLAGLLLQAPPADASQPVATPASASAASRDERPRVFRCVLDSNPRMLITDLGEGWWMAFDTQRCAVHKIWKGTINLTGAVYDDKHGPQPKAVGTFLLDGKTPIRVQVQPDTTDDPQTHWHGHVLTRDSAQLGWSIENLKIELEPKRTATAIELTFIASRVDGDESGDAAVALISVPDDLKTQLDSPAQLELRAGEPTVIRIPFQQPRASTTTSEKR